MTQEELAYRMEYIIQEHIDYMEKAIHMVLVESEMNILTVKEMYRRSGKTEKRMCFDLSYSAGISTWIADNIYPYANDAHLLSALKKVVANLEKAIDKGQFICYQRGVGSESITLTKEVKI